MTPRFENVEDGVTMWCALHSRNSVMEIGWSEEREEIKGKKKTTTTTPPPQKNSQETKNYTKGKILPDFPEFQRNVLQGLVQSFPFNLKEIACHFETRINPIYFLYFQSSFVPFFFPQKVFWMLTKFLTYSSPPKT